MKATLEFSLPEDTEEFETATKSVSFKSAMDDFYNESLRKRLKYEADKYSDNEMQLIETIRSEFLLALDNRGLTL